MPRSSGSSSRPTKSPVNVPAVPTRSFPNPMSSVATADTTKPSFGGIMKEGLAFGAGQAIASRAVASILGLSSVPTSQPASQKNENHLCEKERLSFEACLKTKSADIFCGGEQLTYAQCIKLQTS